MRIWAVVVLALFFTGPAYSLGKTTVDPNIGRVSADDTPASTIAERLARKIDYEAKRKPVASILADLTQLSGVTLKCGWNNKDWQVRDRRMTIFAKQLPLSELMNSIASVMKFKCAKGVEDANPYYRLYMDRKDLVGIERQRLLAEEGVKKCQSDRRKQLLDEYERLSHMTEQEIENLEDQYPELYAAGTGLFSTVLIPLLTGVPDVREAWLLGQDVRLNAATLPASTQDGIWKMIDLIHQEFEQAALEHPELNLKFDPGPSELTEMSIVIEPSISHSTRSAGLRMEMRWPNPDEEMGWSNIAGAADSPGPSEWRKPPSRDHSTGQTNSPPASPRKESNGQMASSPPDFGEPPIEHSDDPELLCKVKLDAQSSALDSIIDALARASEFSIVSDCLGTKSHRLAVPNGQVELRALLDSITSQCRYNWNRHKSILEFRDRDWFRRRSEQIPDEWLEGWKKTLRRTGTLDLDSLAQVTALSYEQFGANVQEDEVLGKLDLLSIFWHYRHLIKLCGSLEKMQRAALFSDSGLDIGMLSSPQMSVVQDIFKHNSEFLINEQARVRIYGSRRRQGKQFEYTFTAVSSDELPPVAWTFTTPKYTPPKERDSDAGRVLKE